MKVFNGEKTHIKSWCNNPESGAIDQAKNLASLPFVFKHVALMPDTHQGYGMPIGGVLATTDCVIPNAVGVDIGCGMCAVKTSLKVDDVHTSKLKDIMGKIREAIPVGKNWNKELCDYRMMPERINMNEVCFPVCFKQIDRARQQLGTLGGGNHFIEIQKDEEDFIWIMIHSGSRNLGYTVAKHYNQVAKDLNKKWYASCVSPSWDLAFLPTHCEEGIAYMTEMQYCVDFALANRKFMMDVILWILDMNFKKMTHEPMINIAHNYAVLENHFGKNVMVHRKGATRAYKDEIGIIPGSQGTSSYIVRGLGNEDSFKSCSHGAGRVMSRTKAKYELNLDEEQKKLDDQGIIHSVRTVSDLDEASGSYKDIDVVMEEQKDLVEIVTKLQPLGVIKG